MKKLSGFNSVSNPLLWWLGYVFLLCLGLSVAIKQAPFYIPDEGAHFLRAYEVSHGHLVNTRGSVGVQIPCKDYAVIATQYQLIAWAQTKTVEEQRDPSCWANTRNTAGAYSFIPYIPAALTMRILDTFGDTTVEQRLIASRAVSFVVWMTLIFVALHGLLHGQLLVGCVALMPSFFWQLAAVSADGATLASCLIYVVLVLRSLQNAQPVAPSTYGMLVLVAAMIGSSKGVYAPLCLLSFALWSHMPASRPTFKWLLLSAPTLVCFCTFVFFTGLADPSLVYLGNGANPAQQVQYVLTHPWQYLAMVFSSIGGLVNTGFVSPTYAVPNAGRGMGIAAIALISGVALTIFSRLELSKRTRTIALLVALLVCLAVCLPLYLTYNPVGHSTIHGLQSRYFLPIIPLVLIGVAFDATKVDWVSLFKSAMWVFWPLLGLMVAVFNIP